MNGRSVVPPWLKIAHLAFVTVLVPVYWRSYGPANFLWFSDLSLFLLTAVLLLENRLLASMTAVGAVAVETFWILDFVIHLISGSRLFGAADYMFDPNVQFGLRALSLFHLWLPPLSLWLVWRLGYDRRALAAQTLLAWALLLATYFLTDPRDNINWAFGLGRSPQHRLDPPVYLALMMAMLPLGAFVPIHLLLARFFRFDRPPDASSAPAARN